MTRTYTRSGNRHNIDTRFLLLVLIQRSFNVSVHGIFPALVRTFRVLFNPSYPIEAWSGKQNARADFNDILLKQKELNL